MNLCEKLERAGWIVEYDSGNVFIMSRGKRKLLFNWLEQEVELIFDGGYEPSESEVETLCEKEV